MLVFEDSVFSPRSEANVCDFLFYFERFLCLLTFFPTSCLTVVLSTFPLWTEVHIHVHRLFLPTPPLLFLFRTLLLVLNFLFCLSFFRFLSLSWRILSLILSCQKILLSLAQTSCFLVYLAQTLTVVLLKLVFHVFCS